MFKLGNIDPIIKVKDLQFNNILIDNDNIENIGIKMTKKRKFKEIGKTKKRPRKIKRVQYIISLHEEQKDLENSIMMIDKQIKEVKKKLDSNINISDDSSDDEKLPKPINISNKIKTNKTTRSTGRLRRKKAANFYYAYSEPRIKLEEHELPPDMLECYKILQQLIDHRYSEPFLNPVDYIKLNIPDYPLIIKNPMDFTTIKEKLFNNIYLEPEDFIKDMELVFSNACLYNPPSNDVYIMSHTLRKLFRDKIKIFDKKDSDEEDKKLLELQESIKILRKELRELKQEKLKEKYKKQEQEEINGFSDIPLTNVEKSKLSRAINSLPASQLAQIVKLIKERCPNHFKEGEDIIIDINSLDTVTQRSLEKAIDKFKKRQQRRTNVNIRKNKAKISSSMQIELGNQIQNNIQSEIDKIQEQLIRNDDNETSTIDNINNSTDNIKNDSSTSSESDSESSSDISCSSESGESESNEEEINIEDNNDKETINNNNNPINNTNKHVPKLFSLKQFKPRKPTQSFNTSNSFNPSITKANSTHINTINTNTKLSHISTNNIHNINKPVKLPNTSTSIKMSSDILSQLRSSISGIEKKDNI